MLSDFFLPKVARSNRADLGLSFSLANEEEEDEEVCRVQPNNLLRNIQTLEQNPILLFGFCLVSTFIPLLDNTATDLLFCLEEDEEEEEEESDEFVGGRGTG
jgi:hypothetical protein